MDDESKSPSIPFPFFELVGPPCEVPGCKGVLVDHLSTKTKDFFQKCSACGAEANRMPVKDKLAWAIRTIDRVSKGQEED